MSSKTEIINFSFLLEQEKKTILSVLERDDRLKKADEKRVRRLKNELLEIQRKGNNRHQLRQQQNSKLCVRCRKSLGLIFNRGSLCQVCHLRVCKACRVVVKDGKWKCTVCAKIAQLKLTTGDWFCEERGKRFRIGTVYGSDIVRKSLLRKIPAVSKPDEEVGDSGKQVPANVQNGSVLENKSAKGEDGRSIRSDIDNQSLYSNRSLPRSDRISSLFDKVTGKKAKSKEDDTLSLQSVRSDRKAKVIVHSDSSQADLTEQENTDKISQASFKVDVLSQSRPGSPVSARGSVDSLDAGVSSPNPKGNAPSSYESSSINVIGTLPSRQSSPTPRKLSAASNSHSRSGMQDGIKTSSSIPEDISKGHERRVSATPSLVISRASLSSGHSKSEFDLSGNFTDENLESISVRSKSVPDHLDKDSEYLDKIDEDFDDLGPSTNMTKSMRSLTSISLYSETGDYGNLRITGEILLNINYSYKTGALNVVVKSCRNLAVADEKKNRTDPYVKAYLLPDKSRQSKRKTKIKTNTTDPDFNETLKYVISHTQLETRTLQLTVWHNDRFGRNSFLGEVDIPLDSWNFENQEDESFPLQPKMDLASDVTLQYKGEITVGLRYVTPEKNLTLPLDKVTEKKSFKKSKKANIKVPSGGLVEVFIKDAKNLTAMKSGGSSDTFVKGYLLPDNNKSTKHKTPVVKKSVNPEWNHTFTFSGLQTSDLSNVCVELTVWGKESLTNNVFLGGVCLGCGSGVSYGDVVDWMDSQGEEQFLWQKMMDSPGTMVEATLMLRPTMAKKKYNSVKAYTLSIQY